MIPLLVTLTAVTRVALRFFVNRWYTFLLSMRSNYLPNLLGSRGCHRMRYACSMLCRARS